MFTLIKPGWAGRQRGRVANAHSGNEADKRSRVVGAKLERPGKHLKNSAKFRAAFQVSENNRGISVALFSTIHDEGGS